MSRALRIILFTIGAVAVLAVAAWVFAFMTPPGRTSLKGLAANTIGGALGAEAKIGRMSGALPGEITLEDVALADADGDYLTVKALRLRWRPFAAIGGRIDIDSVEATGAHWLRRPLPREKNAPPKGFSLPERLPILRIGSLFISEALIDPAIAGAALEFNLQGAISMSGENIDATLAATSAEDFAKVALARNADQLSIDATLASENGALAALANLGGPIFIEAKGSGPLGNADIAVRAALGSLGDFDARVVADVRTLGHIGARGEFHEGPRLEGVSAVLGPSLEFDAVFNPAADGGDLEFSRLAGLFGEASATLAWRNRGDALNEISARLEAALAEDWRPDIRKWSGDTLSLSLALKPNGPRYAADVLLETSHIALELADAETDARAEIKGPFRIHLSPIIDAPTGLTSGAEGAGRIEFVREKTVKITEAALRSGDGATFDGALSYDFETSNIGVDGLAAAAPALVASLAPGFKPDGPISANLSVKGAAENFAAQIIATAPGSTFKDKRLTAARASIDFTGLPKRSAGRIDVRAADNSGRLVADVRRAGDGFWRASNIDYRGRGFALAGEAAANPKSGEVSLDLAYRGEDNAEPWPGLVVAGDLTAKGALSRSAARNRLALKASGLSTGVFRAADLDILAQGPMSRLAVNASAASLDLERFSLEKAKLAARMNADGPIEILLADFRARAGGRDIKLKKPAKIALGETSAIEGFALVVGKRGSLSLDGAFSKTRWRAKLVADELPLDAAATLINANIDLDTDRKEPAHGNIAAISLLTKGGQDRVGFKFNWDGMQARLQDDGADAKFNLAARLPLKLRRAPGLGATLDGPVSGEASYKGRLEPLAAFLPPPLQSLEGDIELEGGVSGEASAPQFNGAARVRNGAYTEIQSGLSIVSIDARAKGVSRPGGGSIDFEGKGAGPGQSTKTISATGKVEFAPQIRLSTKLTLADARLSAGPVASALASGEIDFSGPADALAAKGEITVKEMRVQIVTPEPTGLVPVDVVAVDANGESRSDVAASREKSSIAYDIRLVADDRVFVRGRGVESEWSADARLTGASDAPLVLGDVDLRTGFIEFAGRRFDLKRGAIAFDRLSPNDPALDIRAERTTQGGVAASIIVTGRARSPKITLESSPTLPQEDIMALVLFDKPASELTAFESLQVAQALASLGGIGPFAGGLGVTGKARQALGLDFLSVDLDTGNAGASSLTVGKYVADGLFVSATQDARGENGSIRIEYNVGKSFSVETELRQDGDQTVSANWKKDF